MKSFLLTKFGIYAPIAGLNEVNDSKKISMLEQQLSRKPLQFRKNRDELSVYLSTVELAKIKFLVNGKGRTSILEGIKNNVKLKISGGQLHLMCYNETITLLKVYGDPKTRSFNVGIEEVI